MVAKNSPRFQPYGRVVSHSGSQTHLDCATGWRQTVARRWGTVHGPELALQQKPSRALTGLLRGDALEGAQATEAAVWSTAAEDSITGSTLSPARSPAWGRACQLCLPRPVPPTAAVVSAHTPRAQGWPPHPGQGDLAHSLLTAPQDGSALPRAPRMSAAQLRTRGPATVGGLHPTGPHASCILRALFSGARCPRSPRHGAEAPQTCSPHVQVWGSGDAVNSYNKKNWSECEILTSLEIMPTAGSPKPGLGAPRPNGKKRL